jgi:cytidyltransferase-like protein
MGECSKRRLYMSGVFDLFHYGHMCLINKCKSEFPDATIVIGVHDDMECEKYKRLPIMTMEDRIMTIQESGMVHEIIRNAPLQEDRGFYKKYKIDIVIHAHSPDEHEYYVNNFYKQASEDGIFYRMDYTSHISTTKVLSKILSRNKTKTRTLGEEEHVRQQI